MRLKNCCTLGIILAAVAFAQSADTSAKPQAPVDGAATTNSGDDLFGGLRKKADAAQDNWKKLNQALDNDLKAVKDACSPKIAPMISKVEAAMEAYMLLEREYAKVWSEDAHKRNEMMAKLVMSQSTMADELAKMKAAEEADLAETQRRLDELSKLGPGADDVTAEGKELLDSMNATKVQISKTIDQMSDVGSKAEASKLLVAIREAKIKEYASQLAVELVSYKAVYLKITESYAARCNDHDPTIPHKHPTINFDPPEEERR